MLQSFKALVDEDSTLYWLEQPPPMTEPCRALLTVLDESYGIPTQEELETAKLLPWNCGRNATRPSAEERES